MAQFNAGYSNPPSLDSTGIRLDQAIGSKLNLLRRYNYSPFSLDQRYPPLAGPILDVVEPLSSTVHTATVGLTQIVTSRIANEVRANYSNQRVGTAYAFGSFQRWRVASRLRLVFPRAFVRRLQFPVLHPWHRRVRTGQTSSRRAAPGKRDRQSFRDQERAPMEIPT
jgi:hypothetical protein